MFGLPESTSSNLPTKINDEKCTARDIFSKRSADMHTEFKPIRLGKSTSTSPRRLTNIFDSCDAASSVLLSYRLDKSKNVCLLPLTSLLRDKTRLERQQLRTCHQEKNRRVATVKHSLIITFKNDSPCVITRSKNDVHVHHRPQLKIVILLNSVSVTTIYLYTICLHKPVLVIAVVVY